MSLSPLPLPLPSPSPSSLPLSPSPSADSNPLSPALSAASLSTAPSSTGSPALASPRPSTSSSSDAPPSGAWPWRKSREAAASRTSLYDTLAGPTSPTFPLGAVTSPTAAAFPLSGGGPSRTPTIKEKVLRSLGRSAQSLRTRSNSLSSKSRRSQSRPSTPPPELPRPSQDAPPPVPSLPVGVGRLPSSPQLVRVPSSADKESAGTPPRGDSRWRQEPNLSPWLGQRELAKVLSVGNLRDTAPGPPRSESNATLLIRRVASLDKPLVHPARVSSLSNPGTPDQGQGLPHPYSAASLLLTPPGSPTKGLIEAWEARAKTPPAAAVASWSPQRIIFPSSPNTPKRANTLRASTRHSRQAATCSPKTPTRARSSETPTSTKVKVTREPLADKAELLLFDNHSLPFAFPTPPKRHSAPHHPVFTTDRFGMSELTDPLAYVEPLIFAGFTPELPCAEVFAIMTSPDPAAHLKRAQVDFPCSAQLPYAYPACLGSGLDVDFGAMSMEAFEREVAGRKQEQAQGMVWFEDDDEPEAHSPTAAQKKSHLLDDLEALLFAPTRVAGPRFG